MRPPGTLLAAGLAIVLAIASPGRTLACAFHTTLPEATLSEQIGRSATVIAARPDPDDPFRFAAVAVLRGEAPPDGPPHLVDSGTRGWLSRQPGDAVLFSRDADGTWTRLIPLDAATRPVVERMLLDADLWATPGGAAQRRDVFAGLLLHPDQRLRRLALRELDALPYDVLRAGRYPLPSDALLGGLADVQDLPYAPIRILLLGLSRTEPATTAIAERTEWLARTGVDTNLGAWVTAAIENRGAGGLGAMERLFLDPANPAGAAQRAAVIQALAVHRSAGDPDLRPAIDAALRRLATADPEAGLQIARIFGAASDYSQAPLIRDLVSARVISAPRDLLLAATYVMGADLGTTSAD